ncbi:PA domain protein [Cooperia oncophora]
MMLSFNSLFLLLLMVWSGCCAVLNKTELRDRAYEMFMHGYQSYMTYAYPADELMPLSCRGRVRGVTPSRGDVDDSLGNFSLTLIDTLDTLVVVGALDEFERAVKLIVDNVRFDSDLIVSVFETNIRILGGLLSGHLMAELVRGKDPSRLQWYDSGQLLKMAIDIGDRLLPAFNTSSGLPYSRARKAMDFLWSQRHRASDLMGTVLNVHSGDWVRRVPSEMRRVLFYVQKAVLEQGSTLTTYCLKAYILLGDKSFLESDLKEYVNKGPLFVDVHMHRPTVATRSFMDALLAFWPALQVLKGDVKRAIEMHEMLFQVVQVMDSINDYVRVPCGFAGVKDVRTMSHEDRMEFSFVLSETFKYLYMIFAEPSELIFDPDNYVLTTEAHFLPLNIGNEQSEVPRRMLIHPDDIALSSKEYYVYANPPGCSRRTILIWPGDRAANGFCTTWGSVSPSERLRAWAFSASNAEHIKQLRQMGIDVQVHEDGRMHLSHQTADGGVVTCEIDGNGSPSTITSFAIRVSGASVALGQMISLLMLILVVWLILLSIAAFIICSAAVLLKSLGTKCQNCEVFATYRILSSPYFGYPVFRAAPAQYGPDLESSPTEVERSDCMFQEKSRQAQQAGAVGVIVIDHIIGTSSANEPSFAMAEDKDSPDDIVIPSLFLYYKEGQLLLKAAKGGSRIVVRLSATPIIPNSLVEQFLMSGLSPSLEDNMICLPSEGDFITLTTKIPASRSILSFESSLSRIVERHVTVLQDAVGFDRRGQRTISSNLMRTAAYGALGLNVEDENLKTVEQALHDAYVLHLPPTVHEYLRGDITQVRCLPRGEVFQCVRIAA